MAPSPSFLVFFHIWAGTIGILSGFAALFLRKGSRLHRLAGNVFFVSMLAMAGTAVVRAVIVSQPSNVVAGLFTLYMISTAWMTVRRKAGETGRFEVIAMLAAAALGITEMVLGWSVATSQSPPPFGVPAAVYFVFGSVVLLAAGGDARMLVRGGVYGAQRILRHLWRMGLALFVATGSLFLGQQKVFPEELRGSFLLALPVIVVVVTTIYWVIRVRFSKAYRKSPELVVDVKRQDATQFFKSPLAAK
jgi:uncharacterized membrane protein